MTLVDGRGCGKAVLPVKGGLAGGQICGLYVGLDRTQQDERHHLRRGMGVQRQPFVGDIDHHRGLDGRIGQPGILPATRSGPDADRERLMADAGIVRNRAKVDAFIGNARAVLEINDFSELVWSFVHGAPLVNHWRTVDEIPAATPASERMARELRRLGFRFVGPTICYAFMQSAGLVDDHIVSCFRHSDAR